MSSAVNSAVCCFHQSLQLSTVPVPLVFRLEGREFTIDDAFQCQDPDCDAHYSPTRGYFGKPMDAHPNFGNPMTVPQCRHESEPMYMFLMWKDDVLVWACPIEGCGKTAPVAQATTEAAAR